jgi:hypothetical protein
MSQNFDQRLDEIFNNSDSFDEKFQRRREYSKKYTNKTKRGLT